MAKHYISCRKTIAQCKPIGAQAGLHRINCLGKFKSRNAVHIEPQILREDKAVFGLQPERGLEIALCELYP